MLREVKDIPNVSLHEEKSSLKLWDRLTGDRHVFSMENRAFNYVSLVTLAVLLYSIGFDLYIRQSFMSALMAVAFFAQLTLYYFSRFRKKYQIGIVLYAVCSYLLIFTNYFFNSGITGPTLMIFFLTFHLLVTISKKKLNKLWIILHIIIPLGLVVNEYYHPEMVPYTYADNLAHLTDVLGTYAAVIVFVFLVTNYLRQYYEWEKTLADERALAISIQNEKITEQNIQLAKINEEKNKLFSIVSHDMKAPIDAIKGYLEILSLNLVEPEERLEMETELLNQTKYTSDLLINLLYWSKTQMNGVQVNLRPTSLIEMVEDARNYRIAFAAKKGINLTYSISNDIEVIADTEMMHIVLRNLVNNAIKFTEPGGEINIIATRKNDTAEIEIIDTGVGIPDDKHEQIFTLKTKSTYGTKDEKGIGIGLMLCKEFVEYMHGKIWFESEFGEGSVFHVSLPLAKK